MGHPARDLTERGQPLDLLLPGQVLGLVGIFDDGKVQVHELDQGQGRCLPPGKIACGAYGASVCGPGFGTSCGAGSGGGGYGPYFGSIPDFGQTENGVKFSDVKPGSPAAKAGFKAGDILVQFGDKPIKNLYDFTDALRRSKVGDVVEVTVMRDGQLVKASVKLEQRK